MTILDQLATALGRRDEVPNQDLAQALVAKRDEAGIVEVVALLKHKDKNIQSDCIKVLDEVGKLAPELVAMYDKVLIDLLTSKNNRLVWGAMAALDNIAGFNPKGIYAHLSSILEAMEKGSVITNDRGMNILIKLAAEKAYADNCIELLLDRLKSAPSNQLPMYAENAVSLIHEKHKKNFIRILEQRLPEMDKESKRKRLEKVLRKF